MLTPVSVVIICYNAAATIQKTLASAFLLTDDVVVVDRGSTDDTLSIIKSTGAALVEMEWLGFGANKNIGNTAAKRDWIVSLDADEELSEELIAGIRTLNLDNHHSVYAFHRLNYLDVTAIKHGAWKNDWTVRLFNRKIVCWDDAPVHEKLVIPPSVQVKKLHAWLHHYTAANIKTYREKLEKYAYLLAQKYYKKGKKVPLYKIYFSPLLSFFKNYILQLGVMDGAAGWHLAKVHADYTFKKYKKLKELQSEKKKQ
ncbi:MAG: glycosyltransferase family 2 protein [Chitinophagaceae bacterium]